MPIHRIIYFSGETARLTPDSLTQLAARASVNNTRLGVTGLLLYCHGNFLQILEGDQQAVSDLYQAIREDTRHRRVVTVIDEAVEKRDFPGWGMAFRNLDFKPEMPEGMDAKIFTDWETMSGPELSESVRNILRIFSQATER